MIAAHRLPRDAFLALASGAGDPGVVRHLREAQQSKHLMLLHAVAEAAGEAGGTEAAVAFRVGRRLLGQVQSADPGAVARLLSLPHIGGWAHDCLISLDRENRLTSATWRVPLRPPRCGRACASS